MEKDVTTALPDIDDEPQPEKKEWGVKDKTRGKSMYFRKALVRLSILSPQEFELHECRNMWESMAMAQIRRAQTRTAVGNAALQIIRDTIGEKPKEKLEEGNNTGVVIVDSLPRAKRKLQ